VYNWLISLLPPIVLDNLFGSSIFFNNFTGLPTVLNVG